MNDEEMDLEMQIVEDDNFSEDEVSEQKDLGCDDRRKVEQKLEELRMQRLTQDYDFA